MAGCTHILSFSLLLSLSLSLDLPDGWLSLAWLGLAWLGSARLGLAATGWWRSMSLRFIPSRQHNEDESAEPSLLEEGPYFETGCMYVATYVRTNEGERMCRPRDKYRDRAGNCGCSPCVAPFSLRFRRSVQKKKRKKDTKIRRRKEQLKNNSSDDELRSILGNFIFCRDSSWEDDDIFFCLSKLFSWRSNEHISRVHRVFFVCLMNNSLRHFLS